MPAQLVSEFDLWRPSYGGAVVTVTVGGTSDLASLFADSELTQPIDNPQTLLTMTDVNGINYGKFAQHVYTADPYFLEIDDGENTGIKYPPLTDLTGDDVSNSLVTVVGSSTPNSLADIVARSVDAENFGEITLGGSAGSAATNGATIAAAIGSLGNSGIVNLPAGLIRSVAISIPAGVLLNGKGKAATTLQVIAAGNNVVLTGDKSGFMNMTLDGNNLTAGSIGIYALNRTGTIFEHFCLKNFDTGLLFKGGARPQWRDFDVENCNTGAALHGDKDTGNTGLGGIFQGGRWDGGRVYACTTFGLDLKYVDAIVAHAGLSNITFESNPGSAVRIKGSQFDLFDNCIFTGNIVNIDISDDATVLTPATQYQNKTIGLQFRSGFINKGAVNITGVAQDVIFSHMKLLGVTFNMNAPLNNNVILQDCYEDSNTVITGQATQLVRKFSADEFEVVGITTGAAPVRAWGITLNDNQCCLFEVEAIGVQRNGTNRAIYHLEIGGRRSSASLNYITQTANFTVGDIITGASSGATARAIADADAGTTGTLSLETISGTFVNGEIITGSSGGSANVSGVVIDGAHAADTIGAVNIRAPYETDAAWDVTFAFSAGEIAIQVQGNDSQTVDWTVRVRLLRS